MTSQNEKTSDNIYTLPQLFPPQFFPPGYPPGYFQDFIPYGYYPIYIPCFIQKPEIKLPEVKPPEVILPEVKLPEVKLPEIKPFINMTEPRANQTKRKERSPSPKQEERSPSPKRATTYEPICYNHVMGICKRPNCGMIHKGKYSITEKYKARRYLKTVLCKFNKIHKCLWGESCFYAHNN